MSQISSSYQSTLSAMFDNKTDAADAVDRLVAAGIPESSIRLVPGYEKDTDVETDGLADQHAHKGFFESLADFFFPEEDRYSYAEGLRRGGYLVTVSDVPTGLYDTALDILDDEGAVDLDQREENWRSEGWGGYAGSDYAASDDASYGTGRTLGSSDYTNSSASTTSTSGAFGNSAGGAGTYGSSTVGASGSLLGADNAGAGYRDTVGSSELGSGVTTPSTAGAPLASDTSAYGSETRTGLRGVEDTEVIPVVEEQLRVGKRDVNLGRVRVRSYVREEPVSADVNLHQERVSIERRSVDRPLTGNEAVFQDRVIEAEEHAEEAVVAKEARVTEEIALRKEETNRQETVSDTVRRTEVEVEDDRDIVDRDLNRNSGSFNR